jgi:hypothetical protein
MPKRGPKCKLGYHRVFNLILWVLYTLTVCLGVTSAVVDTYGHGDGRIGPTHCALIAGALGDRCSRCRVCRTPRAAGGSVRSGLVAERRVSIADPCGFHRSRTIPRSTTTPCGDASPGSNRQGCKSKEVQVLCRQLPGSDGEHIRCL